MSVKQILIELQIHVQFKKKEKAYKSGQPEMSYLFQCFLSTYIEFKKIMLHYI